MVEFTCKAFAYCCCFYCYWFNLFTSNLFVSVFHFIGSVLKGCIFLGFCLFLLGCPTCWHITVHIIILWYFLCATGCYFPLSFLILFIWVLCLLFLVNLGKGWSILFMLKKSWFHWYFFLLFLSFVYFLHSVNFGVLLFLFL